MSKQSINAVASAVVDMHDGLANSWVTKSVTLANQVFDAYGDEDIAADWDAIAERFEQQSSNPDTIKSRKTEYKAVCIAAAYDYPAAIKHATVKGKLPSRALALRIARTLPKYGVDEIPACVKDAREWLNAPKSSTKSASTKAAPEKQLLAAFNAIQSCKLDDNAANKKLIEWRAKNMKGLKAILEMFDDVK